MRAAKIIGLLGLLVLAGVLVFQFINERKTNPSAVGENFDDVAYFGALRDEKLSLPGQTAIDFDQMFASMPEIVQITYDETDFNQASGASVLRDVKVSIKKYPDIGVSFDTLSVWGADEGAFNARLAGQRFDETLLIAKRIEAENISMFGLHTFFDQLIEISTDLSTDMVEDMVGGDRAEIEAAMPEQSFEKYDFQVDKIVMTDFVFHPYVLDLQPLPEKIKDQENSENDAEREQAWHWIQMFAAQNYAYGFTGLAVYDTRFDLVMIQDDMKMDMSSTIDFLGYKDFHKGNAKFGVVRNSRTSMDMIPMFDGKNDGLSKPMEMRTDSHIEYYTIENLNFSNVWNHLARGEFPDRTKIDLMSFGKFQGGNFTSTFNDAPFYSIERFSIDLSEFHWLIPEVLDIEVENMEMNVKGFVDYVASTVETAGTELDLDMSMKPEDVKMMNDVISVLEKYDLDAPSMDFKFALHWNAETGMSDFQYNVGLDNFIRYGHRGAAIMPSYEAAMSAVPENLDNFDENELEAVFTEAFRFKEYEISIVDEGGMEKGFAMAIDFAKIMPEDQPGLDMLRNSTPEILRNMASNGILVGLVAMEKSFPPGVEYLQTVSKFIGEGGSLTLALKPEPPMSVAEFEAIEALAKDDPEGIVKQLGVSVVHQPTQ